MSLSQEETQTRKITVATVVLFVFSISKVIFHQIQKLYTLVCHIISIGMDQVTDKVYVKFFLGSKRKSIKS